MEYKNFPLGYGNLDDNFKYIYIILNIFLDNDLLDKNYLLIDKKDHGKRLMNFNSDNGLITFTKGKDGDKYFLDNEKKKILKYGTDTEFNGPLFDEFPTYLLGSIGFFNISDDYKKIELGENIKKFKSLLEKLNLNNFESFNKETFERTEIKEFLKEIFYTSSIYNRINEYLKLGRITDFILKDIISFSHESDPRKEKLNSFIDEKIKSDINLKTGISKADFENSFAVINGQTGRNANNRTAWIYEYLSFLGFITFDYKGNIVFYNDGFSELVEKVDQNIKPKNNDLIKNNIMNNKLTSQEALLLLSLLTKPFSILYGVSGTGKSRVVKELWKKIYGEDSFKNYFYKEAVPPNWFDETEVLGRYNEIEKYKEGNFISVLEKAIKDKDNKYVYLLDEMNLSHIEQYFAQYLSAVEDLSSDNAWIHVGEKTNFIFGSTGDGKFEIISKDKINNYNIVYYLRDIEDIEIKEESIQEKGNINYNSFREIELTGKKINKISIYDDKYIVKGSKDALRKSIEFMIDNYSDIINTEDFKYKNLLSIKKEDLTYGDYAINNYNGYFYANNFSNKDAIKVIYDLAKNISEDLAKNIHMSEVINDTEELSDTSGFIKIDDLFVSKIKAKSLKIPSNLFVIGTINLDETTKSISPKVIDRANLIEFNDIDNYTFLKDNGSYDLAFLEGVNSNIDFKKSLELRLTYDKWDSNSSVWELKKENQTLMQRLYDYLKVFKLHFSYRTINEILTFVAIGKEILGNEYEDKLLDLAFMQKVLPKLNGVIDPSFRLSDDKGEKYLYYISDDIEDSIMNTYSAEIKEILKSGVLSLDNEKLDNTFIKLKRMQQFFNTYQNVNYFLS